MIAAHVFLVALAVLVLSIAAMGASVDDGDT